MCVTRRPPKPWSGSRGDVCCLRSRSFSGGARGGPEARAQPRGRGDVGGDGAPEPQRCREPRADPARPSRRSREPSAPFCADAGGRIIGRILTSVSSRAHLCCERPWQRLPGRRGNRPPRHLSSRAEGRVGPSPRGGRQSPGALAVVTSGPRCEIRGGCPHSAQLRAARPATCAEFWFPAEPPPTDGRMDATPCPVTGEAAPLVPTSPGTHFLGFPWRFGGAGLRRREPRLLRGPEESHRDSLPQVPFPRRSL